MQLRIPVSGIWLTVISCCFLAACSDDRSRSETPADTFPVVQPVRMDTVYHNEFVADIQSVQNVELRTRVKGFLEKIHVDEGQPVKEGQVLFTLSSRLFREELLKANAQLKSTIAEMKAVEVEIRNTRLLMSKNIVSQPELDMLLAKKEAVEAKTEEARSSIALAQLHLSFTEIRAPFSGVINRIPLKTGSLVEEGALLTTISNNNEMFAYFNVSEKEYLGFVKSKEEDKQQVSLLLADNQAFPEKGWIETTENEVDKSTGNIAFRARFRNPQHLLRHGSSGRILLHEKLSNVLVIPQKSAFEIQDKHYVYVLDKENRVRMKAFTPSFRLQHLFVVDAGLTPDDRIIYEGIQQVKEGDRVAPKLIPFPVMKANSDSAHQP